MTLTHATPEPMIVDTLSQAQSVIMGGTIGEAYAQAAARLPKTLLIAVELAAFQAGQLHTFHVLTRQEEAKK